MIRHFCCVAFMILAALLLIPAELSSQSAASKNVTVAATAMTGGCAMFSAAVGGAGDAPPQSAGNGFNVSNLDRAVAPCSDFYQFADGGWAKNNPLPADHSSWATFNKLHDKNEDVLRHILEEAAKDKSAAPGSNWQKIGDYYAACMDEVQIEAAGLKPLDSELARIAEIKDSATLQAEIARLQREGVGAVFDFGSTPDFKDSSRAIADAEQGGLGLPDRQYYRDADDRSTKMRDQYSAHVTNMFKLMGDDDSKAAAE